jgi:hypothetical protein
MIDVRSSPGIPKRSQVTIFDIFLAFITIGPGILGANWGIHSYGWLGGIGGFIAAAIPLPTLLYGIVYLDTMIYHGRPTFPVRKSGVCREGDYQHRPLGDGHYGLFCRCGARYEKRGQHFREVLPDGSSHPYMIWKAFKGWFPDNM